MRYHICFVLVLMLGVSPSVEAVDKVIYGADSRVDVINSTNELLIYLSESTAARIRPDSLIFKDGFYTLVGQTLEKRMNVCPEEEFSQQLSVSDCSGFLVGDDLLVTAGHCVKNEFDCQTFNWVFDYKLDGVDQNIRLPKSSVYGCKEIIQHALDKDNPRDFSLIRLDRKVLNKRPLKYRTEGRITIGTSLAIIGYPTGLPAKIADDAIVRKNDNEVYFSTNLDSFGGNSGSAIINTDTGIVEGILVRGESDYVYDYQRKCRVVKRCGDYECKGEEVTRITEITLLMEMHQ